MEHLDLVKMFGAVFLYGIGSLVWMEKRFIPRTEMELLLEQRRKSTHELANKLQAHELHAAQREKLVNDIQEQLAGLRESNRWIVAMLAAVAQASGIKGVPPPPEV